MKPSDRFKVPLHVPNSFLNLHGCNNYKSDSHLVELCRRRDKKRVIMLIDERISKQFTFPW